MVLTEVDHLTILAAMYLVAVSAAEYLIAILVVVVLADAFVSSSCRVFVSRQYRRQKFCQQSIAATEYSAAILTAEELVVVVADICQQYWQQQLG